MCNRAAQAAGTGDDDHLLVSHVLFIPNPWESGIYALRWMRKAASHVGAAAQLSWYFA